MRRLYYLKGEKRIATRLSAVAMTGKRRYSRTPYVYATAKCLVIPRERVSGGDLCKATVGIRLPFCKRTDCRAPFGARNDEGCGTDCHTPCGGLACRLGRCRKKRATAGAAVKSCSRSKRITTFGHRKSGEHERIRNTLRGETDCHSRLRGFAMTGERKYICICNN